MFFTIKNKNESNKLLTSKVKRHKEIVLRNSAEYKMKLDKMVNNLKQANEASQQHIDDLVKAHKRELGHAKSVNTKLGVSLKGVKNALKEQIRIYNAYKEAKDNEEVIDSNTDSDIVDNILSNG